MFAYLIEFEIFSNERERERGCFLFIYFFE